MNPEEFDALDEANMTRYSPEHDRPPEPAWTKGEWRVGTRSGHNVNMVYADGGETGIAEVYGIPRQSKLTECSDLRWANGLANARLIAAAPKIYAELQRLVTALEPLERDGGWPLDTAGVATLNGARDAMAQARGEPPMTIPTPRLATDLEAGNARLVADNERLRDALTTAAHELERLSGIVSAEDCDCIEAVQDAINEAMATARSEATE